MTKEFSLPIRVYIEDTDAGGIVYYVNYLKFVERSRTEYLRSLGYGKTAILEDGLLLVVHSLDAQYLASARLDDQLVVTTSVNKLARSYVIFDQEVRRLSEPGSALDNRDNQTEGAYEVLCKTTVKVACVTNDMKPTGIPLHIRESIQASLI